jgi:hypothetical protein
MVMRATYRKSKRAKAVGNRTKPGASSLLAQSNNVYSRSTAKLSRRKSLSRV